MTRASRAAVISLRWMAAPRARYCGAELYLLRVDPNQKSSIPPFRLGANFVMTRLLVFSFSAPPFASKPWGFRLEVTEILQSRGQARASG